MSDRTTPHAATAPADVTLAPVPDDTLAPVPDDTLAPVPDDTLAPVPDDTLAPVPDVTLAPVPDDDLAVDTSTPRTEHYDLVVIGSGSGNSVPDEDLSDWRIAMVEGDVFGGTCLNRGCIPSKMFVYTAGIAQAVRTAAQFGIDARVEGVDWRAIRDRVFDRIDPIMLGGRQYRGGLANTDLYEGQARFVGERTLRVGEVTLTADRVVVATGSRPAVPAVPGLQDVPWVTSDTIMRLDDQPARLVVLGAGFIATELGHVFDALGTEVTIVTRGRWMLTGEDDDVGQAVTDAYRDRGMTVHTGAGDVRLRRAADAAVVLEAIGPDGDVHVEADLLLLAVGRVANVEPLDLPAGGIEVGPDGRPLVDEFQRTSVPGVWSLGDASSQHWLKHVANAEARAVAHGIRTPDTPVRPALPVVPSAVFGSPEVASAGARERELVAAGTPHLIGRRDYGSTAYGWAMEDTTSFVKVLVDPATRLLLGVHVVGPYASLVAQPLIQAMALGQTVDEVARGVVYIHPALSEVVENALLDLPASSG